MAFTKTKNPLKDSGGTDATDPGDVAGDWGGYALWGALVGSALLVGWGIAKAANRRGRALVMGENSDDVWNGW